MAKSLVIQLLSSGVSNRDIRSPKLSKLMNCLITIRGVLYMIEDGLAISFKWKEVGKILMFIVQLMFELIKRNVFGYLFFGLVACWVRLLTWQIKKDWTLDHLWSLQKVEPQLLGSLFIDLGNKTRRHFYFISLLKHLVTDWMHGFI